MRGLSDSGGNACAVRAPNTGRGARGRPRWKGGASARRCSHSHAASEASAHTGPPAVHLHGLLQAPPGRGRASGPRGCPLTVCAHAEALHVDLHPVREKGASGGAEQGGQGRILLREQDAKSENRMERQRTG